jgi:hypothetical protein
MNEFTQLSFKHHLHILGGYYKVSLIGLFEISERRSIHTAMRTVYRQDINTVIIYIKIERMRECYKDI